MTYNDLMMAVLSMAAYKKQPQSIGSANFISSSATSPNAQQYIADGFFAATYQLNGKIVIAYRGTDNPSLGLRFHPT